MKWRVEDEYFWARNHDLMRRQGHNAPHYKRPSNTSAAIVTDLILQNGAFGEERPSSDGCMLWLRRQPLPYFHPCRPDYLTWRWFLLKAKSLRRPFGSACSYGVNSFGGRTSHSSLWVKVPVCLSLLLLGKIQTSR